MNISIPQDVRDILYTLNQNGFEAYIVGGCVRDCILDKTPKDWDITTNAKPEETKRLFDKTVDTGIRHGTVTVVINNTNYEVTTYRIEGAYMDHRRPETVEFTSSIKEDLSRRDFTMNAIAYHPAKGMVDPFHGASDIHHSVVRAVGDPDKRFNEDALRMLRALRFSSQLNFEIDTDTFTSIQRNHALIQSISHERVREELTKILLSDFPHKFTFLNETGMLHHILPEFEACFHTSQNHPHHIYNVAMHSLTAVSHIEKEKSLRWTMLLHDIGKPVTQSTDLQNTDHFYGHPKESVQLSQKILRRLKFDNASTQRILRLIEHHDRNIGTTFSSVRRAIHAVGEDLFDDLLKVMLADKKAQNPVYLEDKLDKLDKIRIIYKDIQESGQCMHTKDLAINGDDLIKLGFKQNKQLGEVLKKLLDAVIEDPGLNNQEELIGLAKRFL